MENKSFKYYAFISYSHKDKETANKLQKHLEKYHLSSALQKSNPNLPKKLRPIFIDTSDLIGKGTLKAALQENLENSNYLLVICSPNSAKSPYVNDEVEYFIKAGRVDHIIPLIIDGQPHSGNPDSECFPPALLSLPREQELLGIDFKKHGSREAFIRVIATLLRLDIDLFVSREARERKLKMSLLAAMLAVLAVVAIMLRPAPYDEVLADSVMRSSIVAYVKAGHQYENLHDLVVCAVKNPSGFQQQLQVYKSGLPVETSPPSDLLQHLYDMMKTGEVMPWSRKPIADRMCMELLTLSSSREIQYKFFAYVLEFVMDNDEARFHYGSLYNELLLTLLEIDASIAATLYQIVCVPHLTGEYAENLMKKQNFESLLASVPEQNEHLLGKKAGNEKKLALLEKLAQLKETRGKCVMNLNSCGVFNAYASQIKGK